MFLTVLMSESSFTTSLGLEWASLTSTSYSVRPRRDRYLRRSLRCHETSSCRKLVEDLIWALFKVRRRLKTFLLSPKSPSSAIELTETISTNSGALSLVISFVVGRRSSMITVRNVFLPLLNQLSFLVKKTFWCKDWLREKCYSAWVSYLKNWRHCSFM